MHECYSQTTQNTEDLSRDWGFSKRKCHMFIYSTYILSCTSNYNCSEKHNQTQTGAEWINAKKKLPMEANLELLKDNATTEVGVWYPNQMVHLSAFAFKLQATFSSLLFGIF